MRRSTISLFLGTACAAGGCANNPQNAIQAVNPDQAAKMNAARTQFDSVKDPPITADTHFAAGQLAETQDNPAAAAEQYMETLKDNPNHLGALYRLGVLFSEAKQYPKAIEYWQRYVQATNGSATAYANLGFCQEIAGAQADAATSFRAGIAQDPKNAACRVNYGLMLARAGDVEEGTRQWRAVLSEAEVHYNLGSVFEMQGNKERAREEYQQAINLDGRLTDARTRLAALDTQSASTQ